MAKSLIKYFGIGGKKNPPHPPKPDYTNTKSNSVQDLTGRFHTTDRTCRSSLYHTSGSQFATFDTRSHSSRASPRHYRYSQSSVPQISSNSKQKETSSTASSDSNQSKENTVGSSSGSINHIEESAKSSPEKNKQDNKSEGNPTVPPKLLDEYSDPFDLKKQIAENPGLVAKSPAEEDLPSVSDDDYSVPFEIKNMRDKKLREKEKQSKQNAAKYENSKFEQLGSVGGNKQQPQQQQQGASRDVRPKEEYDDPWEWSVSHSIIFQDGKEPTNIPEGCVKVCPDESKRDAVKSSNPDNNGDDSVHDYENSTCKRHDYVNTQIAPPPGRLPPKSGEVPSTADIDGCGEEQGAVGGAGARPKEVTNAASRGAASLPCDRRIGNYEEPWDLSITQERLEECFKAKVSTSDDAEIEQKDQKKVSDSPLVVSPPDTRPQEGYEKPWDWKPDRKDDRQQEGYEKPWDWKPHQKDDRPMEEYDQPWDKKQAQLQQNILKAKSAKEIKGCASNVECSKTAPQDVRPKIDSKHSSPKMPMDSRPMEEYDAPWDQKTRKQPISRSVSESSQPQYFMEQVVLASPQHIQRASPSHRIVAQGYRVSAPPPTASRTATTLVGERIDPKVPLEKQGWYHGAISRVDAERLLRVHKEGSYLVRMSESNKQDFSLSLKSARGFMHMKIVTKNGKFILGQFSQPFSSIPLMINHYSLHKLPIKGAEHMSLLHPVIHELL